MSLQLVHNNKQLVMDIVDDYPPGGRLYVRVPLTIWDVQLARDEAWWYGVRENKLKPE